MSGKPEQYRLASDVIFVPVEDGSARLLDMSGSFFALSSSGASMLRGVLDVGVSATVENIANKFNVDATRVQADLRDLLDRLRASRLLKINDVPSEGSRILRAATRRAIGMMLRVPFVLRSPAALLICARGCFAVLGWAETVSAWCESLQRTPVQHDNREFEHLLDAVDQAIRDAAARLPSVACKERALCAWFLLRGQGVPATLVVGIQLFPLAGHCWCEVGSRTLTDFEDRCKLYIPVARYHA